eukprot:3576371-Pleurochrysis_carterae.AAC.1
MQKSHGDAQDEHRAHLAILRGCLDSSCCDQSGCLGATYKATSVTSHLVAPMRHRRLQPSLLLRVAAMHSKGEGGDGARTSVREPRIVRHDLRSDAAAEP